MLLAGDEPSDLPEREPRRPKDSVAFHLVHADYRQRRVAAAIAVPALLFVRDPVGSLEPGAMKSARRVS